MSSDDPSLDDLIRAQRLGVRMTAWQRAANRARLLSRVVPGVIGASAGSAASSASVGSAGLASSWLAKAALGIVLAGGASAAYVYARHPVAGDAIPGGPAPSNVAPPATQTARLLTAPPAVAAVPVEATESAPAIAGSVAQAPVTHRSKRSSAPSLATASASPSLAVEVQLMHDVDSALKSGQPERALSLLDERRPGDGGYMWEERAAARVFALCQLGRVESARAAAARFLRDRPRSPLSARVRATCAARTESSAAEKPQ